jgi:hypothetical protein
LGGCLRFETHTGSVVYAGEFCDIRRRRGGWEPANFEWGNGRADGALRFTYSQAFGVVMRKITEYFTYGSRKVLVNFTLRAWPPS